MISNDPTIRGSTAAPRSRTLLDNRGDLLLVTGLGSTT